MLWQKDFVGVLHHSGRAVGHLWWVKSLMHGMMALIVYNV